MDLGRQHVEHGIPKKGQKHDGPPPGHTTEQQQTVRLNKGGVTFEVLTEYGSVLAIQNGTRTFDNSILAVDRVFTSVRNGDVASNAQLESAFGSHNVSECAREICENGEVVLTQQQRNQQSKKNKGQKKRLNDD